MRLLMPRVIGWWFSVRMSDKSKNIVHEEERNTNEMKYENWVCVCMYNGCVFVVLG